MRSLSEKRSETRKISHNPEVSGSNPLPATQESLEIKSLFSPYENEDATILLSTAVSQKLILMNWTFESSELCYNFYPDGVS